MTNFTTKKKKKRVFEGHTVILYPQYSLWEYPDILLKRQEKFAHFLYMSASNPLLPFPESI